MLIGYAQTGKNTPLTQLPSVYVRLSGVRKNEKPSSLCFFFQRIIYNRNANSKVFIFSTTRDTHGEAKKNILTSLFLFGFCFCAIKFRFISCLRLQTTFKDQRQYIYSRGEIRIRRRDFFVSEKESRKKINVCKKIKEQTHSKQSSEGLIISYSEIAIDLWIFLLCVYLIFHLAIERRTERK